MFRRTYNVITIGGATRDIMFYSDAGVVISNSSDLLKQKLIGFEYGAKIQPKAIHFVLGGGGCNSAVSLARLGLKTATFIRLGLDRDGDAIQSDLGAERIDTRFVERDPKERTGISFIVVCGPAREHTAFLFRGANDLMKMTQAELNRAKTKWFYVSSLTGKYWLATLHNLMVYLSGHPKVKLAWNPGETQLQNGKRGLASLLKLTQVLIMNKDEATELAVSSLGRISGINNPWTLLKIIHSWGPKVSVITQGKKGAYVFDGQKRYFEKGIPKKEADTTGAGDAFGSTFTAGLILFKGNIQRALRLAIINSASVVTKIGAQNGLLSRSRIMELVKKYYRKDW